MSYQRVASSEEGIVPQHAIQIEHGVEIEDVSDSSPESSHRSLSTSTSSESTSTSTSSTSTFTSPTSAPGGAPTYPMLTILRSGLVNSKSTTIMSSSWTLAQLKTHVMTPEEKNEKTVKVIYMGRVLKDDTQTLAQCGIEPDTCIQFHLSEKIEPIPQVQTQSTSDAEHVTDEELLYQQYWQQQQQYIHTTPVFAYDQPTHTEMEGNNADIIVGFILGFLLGFLALIWVWQHSVTRRQKLGIMAGIGASLISGTLKVMLVKDAQQNHSGTSSRPGGPNDAGPSGVGLP